MRYYENIFSFPIYMAPAFFIRGGYTKMENCCRIVGIKSKYAKADTEFIPCRLILFCFFAQRLLCRDGGEGVTQLDEKSCHKGELGGGHMARDGIG